MILTRSLLPEVGAGAVGLLESPGRVLGEEEDGRLLAKGLGFTFRKLPPTPGRGVRCPFLRRTLEPSTWQDGPEAQSHLLLAGPSPEAELQLRPRGPKQGHLLQVKAMMDGLGPEEFPKGRTCCQQASEMPRVSR